MEMNNHASVVPQVGSAAAGVALIILWGGNLLYLCHVAWPATR